MKLLKLRSSWSLRLFGLFVFAALLLGSATQRSQAQSAPVSEPQANPASAPQAASEAAPAGESAPAASETKKESEGESEENAFRHSAVVQAIARFMHVDVVVAAWIFEILNFAVIFFAIVIPLVKVMPKLLRKRKAQIGEDIASAHKVTEDANARLKTVEDRLSRLDEEIATMRAQAEEDGKHDEARIKATIAEESARVVSAAEQEIVSAAAQVRRGLQRFAADLAIEQGTKQLVLTPETDRALITEFIKSADKGGLN